MRRICIGGLILIPLLGCTPRQDLPLKEAFQAWVADPNHRVFPGSFGRNLEQVHVEVQGARNEWVMAQLAVKSPVEMNEVTVEVSNLKGPGGTISSGQMRVCIPEFLPVNENGQLTPDPLRVTSSFRLPANQAQPIWIDFRVPPEIQPGEYEGTIGVLHYGERLADFRWLVKVLDFTLPPMPEDHFYFNILMDLGSIARLHRVDRWTEEHWYLVEKYVENWAQHSQDAVTVFIVEDPWEGDTGFPVASVLIWRLEGAWEELSDPQFEFDYRHFDRFVEICLEAGIDQNIQCWSPVMMPHRDYSVVTYEDTTAGEVRQIKAVVGGPDYERIWSQFAKSLEGHLRERDWLELTTVGLDEISTENLDKIVPIFRRIAPDLQLMVSGGDEQGKYSEFSPEIAFHYGFVNSEVPLPDPERRRREGKRTLFYTANTPLYPNTFLFSEAHEPRMLPWLVWKYNFDGYIRWAWNFWFDDFREQPQYKWHSGDMFMVYPGEDGPVDSIRSEMFRKGAQDYECLWLIRQQLNRLRQRGELEVAGAIEESVREAVELATQEVDPMRPYRPLPSELTKARELLNDILLELLEKG